jgi:hypothetical protein
VRNNPTVFSVDEECLTSSCGLLAGIRGGYQKKKADMQEDVKSLNTEIDDIEDKVEKHCPSYKRI